MITPPSTRPSFTHCTTSTVKASPAFNLTLLSGFALLYSSMTVYWALFAAIGANEKPADAKSASVLICSFSFLSYKSSTA